jgi:hypothetical protein
MKNFTIKLLLLLFFSITSITYTSCGGQSGHPSDKYDYYIELRKKYIPISEGVLYNADTTIKVFEMGNTTVPIYQIWYLTPEGFVIRTSKHFTYIKKSDFPKFSDGEELSEIQLKNVYDNVP